MKFHIFGVWEKIIKPVLYSIVFASTIALICVFFRLDSGSQTYNIYAFVAPVVYALFLFLANIFLERSKQNVSELLYEREGCYLSLMRLREVANATINKIDKDDLHDIKSKIMMFQIMTGRDESTINALANGNKAPHSFVRENGFIYTSKMRRIETEVLSLTQEECADPRKATRKSIQRLIRCYRQADRKLEDNILRLKRTYAGELQRLVDNDNYFSDFEFKIEDAISKIEDNLSLYEETQKSHEALEENVETTLEFLKMSHAQLMDRLEDIESLILSSPEDMQFDLKATHSTAGRKKDEQI